ncbi:hypothetical protein [Bacillus xiapuensis]|uniref:Uncharacterized protein n=1 Tax=Bacillus xiapuensis TaxID=2014075 RepID=A0ABU6N7M2_9BACI|nr:hypothetical protein [Bacillus xiapuensis]
MNINKISEGQVFKNYKVLCTELEMEIKPSAKGREYQLKELSRFCKFTKNGHKITIEEIYPIPLPKIDGRGKDSIYGNLVQLLIADLLAQSKGHISISRSKMMANIGMVNDNYSEGRELIKKIALYVDINEKVVYDFYNTTSGSFKQIVETALKSLMDKRVIMYNTVIKVSEKHQRSTRTATTEELQLIMDVEKTVLKELGYKTISDVRVSKDWKWFKENTKEMLHKQSNINFYFTAYDITIHEEYIVEERNELVDLLLNKVKRQESKDELNELILANLLINAQKRNTSESKSKKMERVRRDFNYVANFEKLTNLLIDKSTSYQINKISNMKTFQEELVELGLSCEGDFDPFDDLFA